MSHRWRVQLSTLVSWDFWLEGHWGLCHVNPGLGPHDGTRRAIPPALCGVLSPAPHYTAQLNSFTAAYLHSLNSFFLFFFFFLIVRNVLDTHPFIKSVINLLSLRLFKSGLLNRSVHPRLVREIIELLLLPSNGYRAQRSLASLS